MERLSSYSYFVRLSGGATFTGSVQSWPHGNAALSDLIKRRYSDWEEITVKKTRNDAEPPGANKCSGGGGGGGILRRFVSARNGIRKTCALKGLSGKLSRLPEPRTAGASKAEEGFSLL